MVKLHDITVLAETRTSDASRLLQHLPGFTVHNIQLDRGNEGNNRHGIAVLVASSCSDYVLVLKTSENVQCIWMQCDKKMFGLEKDVIVGAMLRTSTRKVVIYFLFVPFKLILLTCLRTLLVLFRCLLMSYCVVTLTPMWGS